MCLTGSGLYAVRSESDPGSRLAKVDYGLPVYSHLRFSQGTPALPHSSET